MTKDAAHFEIFPTVTGATKERTGEYAWRFKAGNGQIVASGAESYTSREGVNRAIHGFLGLVSNPASVSAAPHTPIYDVDVDGERVDA